MMQTMVRVVIISIFAATLLFSGIIFWAIAAHRGNGPLDGYVRLVIPRGASLTEVATQLQLAEIIRHPTLFILAAYFNGLTIKAGEFDFTDHMSAANVLRRLDDGKTVVRRLTVPEGLLNSDVAHLLENATGLEGILSIQFVEGTLFPDTYHYSYGDSRDDVARRMAQAMQEVLYELWPHRLSGLPIETQHEAVILASIVEKETAVAEERPRVAAVFLNRLRKNMRLQSDSTVAYALTRTDNSSGAPLTRHDLQIDSLFNTYRYAGLPPEPISNPGRAAIEAVLRPLETDEIFFVADGSGGHAFARTLEEHNRNVARWRAFQSFSKVE
jgi:UPF0755 protein